MSGGSHLTRVLVLGDAGIGKTSLARTITNGVFPSAASLPHNSPHPPMEFKTTPQTSILIGDVSHVIHIHDAAGADLVSGTKIDVVYLCFDVSCQATFDAIQTTWMPRARAIKKDKKKAIQYILIGLKSDQARPSVSGGEDDNQPITASVASQLANEIQASLYVEVSSLKHLGIEKLKEHTVFSSSYQDSTTTTSTIFSRHKDKCRLM